MLEPFIEDDVTLVNLKKIIEEENNHIEKLKKFVGKEAELTVIGD